MSAVPLAVKEVGVTDSDFFTQDDPYQRQGDERQPRYLMGGCPAGKCEGRLLLLLKARNLLGLRNRRVHRHTLTALTISRETGSAHPLLVPNSCQ